VRWRRSWNPRAYGITTLRVLEVATFALVAVLCVAGIALWHVGGPIVGIAAVILFIYVGQERRRVRLAETLAELNARVCQGCRVLLPAEFKGDRCPECGAARLDS
jgi:hypothetical protein